MNGLRFLGAPPRRAAPRLRFLAAPPAVEEVTKQLQFLRDSIDQAWNRLLVSYLTEKFVAQDMPPGAVPPGGVVDDQGQPFWSPEREQQGANLEAAAKFMVRALKEALAGERRVSWDDAAGVPLVESLPLDPYRVEAAPPGCASSPTAGACSPVLVDNKTGQPAQVPGTVAGGTVGVLPAGAVVIVQALSVVAVAGLAYFLVVNGLDKLRELKEAETAKQLTLLQEDCIKSGKCTPEQASDLSKTYFAGAAAKAQAEAAKKAAEGQNSTLKQAGDLVGTLVIGAVVLGVLYAGLQIFKSMPRGGAAPAQAAA